MPGLATNPADGALQVAVFVDAGAGHDKAAALFLEKRAYEFTLAIAADPADEELFSVLPPDAVCVKIGAGQSHARYRIAGQEDVLQLLQALMAGPAGLAGVAVSPGDDQVASGEEQFKAGKGQDQVH